ncbi:MAG: hypothetical protein ACM359_18825, partial [Bacillota bacterium]
VRLFMLFMLLLVPAAYAADAPDPSVPRPPATAADTVRAATAKAVGGLYEQIAPMSITPNFTVAQFLERMEAQNDFMKELQRAEQLGSPRWIDAYTCQVQLEMPVVRIAYALKRIASARPKVSPVTAVQIDLATHDWQRDRFTATGSSAAIVALKDIRPRPDQRWARVDDKAREAALEAATDEAIRHAMDSVSPVQLAERKTLGDAFANPEVGQPIHEWLASRPVNRVDFREDMVVEVALAVDDRDFFDETRSVIKARPNVAQPRNDEEWNQVYRQFVIRFRPAIGRVPLRPEPAPATRVAAAAQVVQVNIRVPEWVTQRIDVQGSAPVTDSKLRALMRAEIDARNKLRERMEALPLDQNFTVGEVAKKDRRMADTLARCVRQARVFRNEIRSDGTALVSVVADMRQFWDDLSR